MAATGLQPGMENKNVSLNKCSSMNFGGARCGSMVRAFAHGAMGRRIDLSWGGPIELFLVVCAILSVGWCI